MKTPAALPVLAGRPSPDPPDFKASQSEISLGAKLQGKAILVLVLIDGRRLRSGAPGRPVPLNIAKLGKAAAVEITSLVSPLA
jgi:hypothetical protein